MLENNPEYRHNCQIMHDLCLHLSSLARELAPRLDALQEHCSNNTVRKVYASGSTLHRGYYCPSPTYDIIIGNTKRGKLLKHLTTKSNPSHEYGFDKEGKLLYCKTFHNRRLAYTEYLIYEDQRALGITISATGNLHILTEEVLHDGRLTDYFYGLFVPQGNECLCYEITTEHYEYDKEGLCACDMRNYLHTSSIPADIPLKVLSFIPKQVYRHIGRYQFERENGLLVRYTNQSGRAFQIHVARNA